MLAGAVAVPIQAGLLGRLVLVMLAGAVALPIQAGLLGRLIVMMLAIHTGSLGQLMLVMLAGGLANASWIAEAADAHGACRWPCQYKLDRWGG